MNFTYDAMSTDLVYVETGTIVSKEYKGIGNSSLANVTINYMKVRGPASIDPFHKQRPSYLHCRRR